MPGDRRRRAEPQWERAMGAGGTWRRHAGTALQAGGRGFEPLTAHQTIPANTNILRPPCRMLSRREQATRHSARGSRPNVAGGSPSVEQAECRSRCHRGAPAQACSLLVRSEHRHRVGGDDPICARQKAAAQAARPGDVLALEGAAWRLCCGARKWSDAGGWELDRIDGRSTLRGCCARHLRITLPSGGVARGRSAPARHPRP